MASEFDREKSIHALLEGARRSPASQEPGPACLDAEELAAWADGRLDAEAVRAIEAHVADCTRCQAMSAAFFSSDETIASGAEIVQFRRNPAADWLPIAVGTIAATLVIWIGVGKMNDEKPEAETTTAESRRAEPTASTAESRQQEKQKQEGTNALAAPQANTATPAPSDAKRLERKEPAPVELRADAAAKVAAPPPAASTPQLLRPSPAPVLPPAVAMPPPPPPPPVGVTAASPVVAPPTTASGAVAGQGAGGALRQTATLRESVEPRIVAEFSSVLAPPSSISGLPPAAGVAGGGAAGGRGGGGGGAGRGGGRAASITLDAVATTPPFYWRILATDVIERSVDRLKWEAVMIEPPVQGLAGGAAPSATVCWIVGRGGLVLRTTDGKQFTRVTPPLPADLIAIAAQDALRATVTTAAGQMFTTVDGGKTWK